MAGRLHTKVVGEGASALLLVRGIVGCGDYVGASYDTLADGRLLVIPDLLGFGTPTGRRLCPNGSDEWTHSRSTRLATFARVRPMCLVGSRCLRGPAACS